MAPSPRRGAPAKTRSAIPQVAWRQPRPAPIVLVSGPEDVLAERAIAGLRDYLRAEDASLEITDVRADDYVAGTLLGVSSPSLFGEPRLVRIAGVEVAEIDPLEWGGWGYRVTPGRSALVLRRGPGLVIHQSDGRRFAVTLDDPRTPAALLTALQSRARG